MKERQAFETGGEILQRAKEFTKLSSDLWGVGLKLTSQTGPANMAQAGEERKNLVEAYGMAQKLERLAYLLAFAINDDNNLDLDDSPGRNADQCEENMRKQAVAYLIYTETEREAGRVPKFFGAWTLAEAVKPITGKG